MTDPVILRLPWFTLYGMPDRPGRWARLRCAAAMLVHEAVELTAGTTTAHAMRDAVRYQIGAPTIVVPASQRNRLYLTTVADGFPDIGGELVGGRAGVELRVYATGTIGTANESIFNPGPLVEVRVSNPVTGQWEVLGNGAPWGIGSPERIGMLNTGEFIATGGSEAWHDGEDLREHGQVAYDPVTEQWIFTYTSGYPRQVGALLSNDGETWTPHSQNPITPTAPDPEGNPSLYLSSEDPYIVKNADDGTVWRDSLGRAHLYCESKVGVAHRTVRLWRSAPGTLDDWTMYDGNDYGEVIDFGEFDAWDETFRASPAVFFYGGVLHMLYEGAKLATSARYPGWVTATAYDVGDIVWVDGPLTFYRCITAHTSDTVPPGAEWELYYGQNGALGYAVSTDEGETFTANPEPLLPAPDEGGELVIDDVILIEGRWVIIVHNRFQADSAYTTYRFWTEDDPSTWGPDSFQPFPDNPFTPLDGTGVTNTLMLWGNDPTKGVAQTSDDVEIVLLGPGYLGPSSDAFANMQAQVNSLTGDVGTLETDVSTLFDSTAALGTRTDNLHRDAAAAGHFAADIDVGRYEATDAWLDVSGLAGPPFQPLDGASQLDPTAGPLVLIPGAVVDVQAGAASLVPSSAPTAGAVLYGVRLNGLELSGVPTGTSSNVTIGLFTFTGAPTGQRALLRGAGADEWTLSVDPINVSIDVSEATVAAPGPVDALFVIQPSDDPAGGIIVSWYSELVDGTWPTVTIDSVEWLWQIPADDLIDAAPTPDPTAIISTPTTITEPGYYYLVDGADVTLPSAAANVGADLYLQTTGTGDATITPFSGDAVQNAFDGFTLTAWDWEPEIIAHWRAAASSEFGGVPAWVAVSLDSSAAGGSGIPATIIDADSDLIVGTAADTAGRLAVPASTIVGRKASGSIAALTPAEARAIIDDEWTEVARYTTATSNDWPTFSSVPTADRYRLRWFYAPTGSPSSNGGLSRSLILTLDADTTTNTYVSNGTQTSSGIAIAAFGQGGAGFGEVEFYRTVSRFAGAPVIRYGMNGMVDVVSGTGAVSAGRGAYGCAYIKLDGSVPDLSTWAIASSNNDAWRAGITFILETASLP